MSERSAAHSGPPNRWVDQQGEWEGESADAGSKRLSRSEAEEFRLKFPASSPWQVIAAQAALGVVVALLGWLLTGFLKAGRRNTRSLKTGGTINKGKRRHFESEIAASLRFIIPEVLQIGKGKFGGGTRGDSQIKP